MKEVRYRRLQVRHLEVLANYGVRGVVERQDVAQGRQMLLKGQGSKGLAFRFKVLVEVLYL